MIASLFDCYPGACCMMRRLLLRDVFGRVLGDCGFVTTSPGADLPAWIYESRATPEQLLVRKYFLWSQFSMQFFVSSVAQNE